MLPAQAVCMARASPLVPYFVQLEGPGEPLKVDESSLTGESEAVTRRPGDTVS